MKLVELTSEDKEAYNRFVAEQPSGSFLQSWEWGQWQEKLGKQVFRYWILDESGNNNNHNYDNNIVSALQVIKTPLPFGRYYLYIPYGPVFNQNFKFQISNFKSILNELKLKFPKAVFVRVEPKANIAELGKIAKKTVNIQPAKTLIIDLQKTEEQLLSEMHHKTRYNIKVARRHGVEITSELLAVPRHGLYIKEILELIALTAHRQSFQTFPLSYYEQLLDFFALQNSAGDVKLHVYKALHERELLSAAIILDFGGTRTYLFGGSGQHHREAMAPHLLHFTAMMDAKVLGLKYYDFWGIETASGETPGFVRFKLGFAPRVSDLEQSREGQSDSGSSTPQLSSGSLTPQHRSGSSSGVKEYPGAYDVSAKRLLYHGYKTLRHMNRAWLSVKSVHKKFKKSSP